MSITRNNHYVAQWYQEGFFEDGKNTLAYLDLTPPQKTLNDGRVITERALFPAPTSRAFRQMDLYSTFFGTSVNDEIERRLFGDIDTRGSAAVRAYIGSDVEQWMHHFQTLFEYIDIQKIRTPKGLDWLRTQYPSLTQNELMLEMQGIRMMHSTIWAGGIREIVSAEDSDVKFVVSDHPITIYNHAAPPDAGICAYPLDPGIALRASQTLFPLNRDFCLILTNLEYARDPSTSPLIKRTFARNYQNSMVRTDALMRTRKLTTREVTRVNFILKARARRYIAAGRKEWLYPERTVSEPWHELKETLLPPKNGLFQFGGEMYAKFSSGRVHYQDEFGRTEQQRPFLVKEPPAEPLGPRDICGCGSGRHFKACCSPKPLALRPSWNEPSIRERNIMLYNGIANVLVLNEQKSWVQVRRDMTDEQISTIYTLYEGLWPRETDILSLLPKPDGSARAVYTGSLHPTAIVDYALGASVYFGELLIQSPFLHAGTMNDKFSPVKNPGSYRGEILKSIFFFFAVMPLVDAGFINLYPDPCFFDLHLRNQMLQMAKSRSAGFPLDPSKDPRGTELMRKDCERGIWSMPHDVLRHQMLKASPGMSDAELDDALKGLEVLKERDPLAVLQEHDLPVGEEGGQMNMMTLAPNFEMAMYLAQATGSCIVTDNPYRWQELNRAIYKPLRKTEMGLPELARRMNGSTFSFAQNGDDVVFFAENPAFTGYATLMRDAFSYLSDLGSRQRKPHWEAHLAARFARTHAAAQKVMQKARVDLKQARMSCAAPLGGIQDNTVNRLLLMSSSENHLPNVPLAFFIEPIA